MAYVRTLPNPKCCVCGKRATMEVLNNRNGVVGKYSSRHGRSKARWLTQEEQASTRAISDSTPPGRMVGADRCSP